jgi:hypothetical protein
MLHGSLSSQRASELTDSALATGDNAIPDSWRLQYFGTTNITTATCASCDPDGDGYSNLQEYNLGTDPTNAASYPTSIHAGLVAWWELNEGSGTTVADASGNGYSGTL